MAKKDDKPEPEPAVSAPVLMPLASAREAARVEQQRWQHIHDVLAAAASVEETHGISERRIAEANDRAAAAEAESTKKVNDAWKAISEAEESKDVALEHLRQETEAAAATLRDQLETLRRLVTEAQDELVQIERDRDGARAKAEADLAAMQAQLAEARAALDALKAKLAA